MAVYNEIRHENGPYFAVILVTVNRHCIQHRILYRIRSYAYRILITNGRKPPAWIPVTIRCVNGPYLTVYGRICAVLFDQGGKYVIFFCNARHMICILLQVLQCITLTENQTTSSSRVFIKYLFIELLESMGLFKLNKQLNDEVGYSKIKKNNLLFFNLEL
jgi:hypothetical protein